MILCVCACVRVCTQWGMCAHARAYVYRVTIRESIHSLAMVWQNEVLLHIFQCPVTGL